MKRTFLNHDKPLVTAMIENTTLAGCLSDMRIGLYEGADAYAVNFALLDPECGEPENLKKILHCTSLPIMLFAYREYNLADADDDARAAVQLKAAELGATGCDVMGDLFSPDEMQLTRDPAAIRKQKELIDRLHGLGAEVIMSSHTKVPVTPAYALEHLSRMAERGADIAKLVAYANTPEEFVQAVETTRLLKEKLPVPFIYLCSGKYGPMHRYVSAALGSAITFTAPVYRDRVKGYQPLTGNARRTVDELMRGLDFIP